MERLVVQHLCGAIIIMKTFKCNVCFLFMGKEEFYVSRTNTRGFGYTCKDCSKRKSISINTKRKQNKINLRQFEEDECWACLLGFEKYEISTKGRIYSTVISNYLIPDIHFDGYVFVKLYSGILKKSISIHRLVALTFIDNPQDKPEVHHKNYNKKCNTIDNLEWNTTKENINDAINKGVRTRTINLKKGMFSDADIKNIKNMFLKGMGNQEICKIYECCHSTICKIRTGVHYPNINI